MSSEEKQDETARSVCQFYISGKCRFGENCWNLHPEGAMTTRPDERNSESKRTRGSAKQQKATDNLQDIKKKPMKTVTDVISRIIWDSDLDSQNFTVGYLDRFRGVVEQPFTTFEWGDIASVDYNALAIPKHRIQYIKYKHLVVWDKTKRIDLVFGSTGAETPFSELIKTTDQEEVESLSKGLKNYVLDTACSDQDARANYFLCVRVTNPEVATKTEALRNHLQEKLSEEMAKKHLLQPSMYHITTALVYLESAADISKARQCVLNLNTFFDNWRKNLPDIKFKGLKTVGSRVMYIGAEVDDRSEVMLKELIEYLTSIGLTVRLPNQDYHLTVLKASHPNAKISTDCSSCDEFLEKEFGNQIINNVYLCCIGSLNQEKTFYECVASINI